VLFGWFLERLPYSSVVCQLVVVLRSALYDASWYDTDLVDKQPVWSLFTGIHTWTGKNVTSIN